MRLRRRNRHALVRSSVALALLGASSTGCRNDAPPVHVDSAARTVAVPAESATVAPTSNGWRTSAGPVLLAAGGSPDEAIVFFGAAREGSSPALDTGAVDQSTATLLGRDGSRFTATLELPAGNDTAECRVWPLRNLHSAGGVGAWAVGFVSPNVVAIPLDSVDALSARDSMALAAEASRLASTVTANTSPLFQGLRFAAHDLHRFEVTPGVQALAAHLMRRVNQEDDPQEEQTLLIAERDSGVTSGPYQLAYAERSFGREEEVSMSEVVAAVRIGTDGPPSLVVARDGDEGLAYALLERTGPRHWRVGWTSTLAKCGD